MKLVLNFILILAVSFCPFLNANNHDFVFLNSSDAKKIIVQNDDFISRLSPFDLSSRMQVKRSVSHEEFQSFLAAHVRDWSNEEKSQVAPIFETVLDKAKKLGLKFDGTISLVKTSGREEGGAFYTRMNSIFLPEPNLKIREKDLKDVIAHELFHVFSRKNESIRKKLYQSIGFETINEISFPESIANRKITNPDAPINNSVITVTIDDNKYDCAIVLFSTTDTYDGSKGEAFFRYLTIKLMAVADDGTPKLNNKGEPVLFDIAQASDFKSQVGENTGYILHAEEILASNFAQIITGMNNVASPVVHEKIISILNNQ